MKKALLLVSCFVLTVLSITAFAENRALVIGNSYPGTTSYMQAAITSSSRMANALRNKGYEVTSINNLSSSQILRSVQDAFGEATDNDISLFYYTGHGGTDITLRKDYDSKKKLKSVVGDPRTAYIDTIDNTPITYAEIINIGDEVGYSTVLDHKGSRLEYTDLLDELDKIKGKKVIILGNCHSGAIVNLIKQRGNSEDYFVITGSAGYEMAIVKGSGEDQFLLADSLIAEALESDNISSFQEVVQYVINNFDGLVMDLFGDYFRQENMRPPTITFYPPQNDLVLDRKTGFSETSSNSSSGDVFAGYSFVWTESATKALHISGAYYPFARNLLYIGKGEEVMQEAYRVVNEAWEIRRIVEELSIELDEEIDSGNPKTPKIEQRVMSILQEILALCDEYEIREFSLSNESREDVHYEQMQKWFEKAPVDPEDGSTRHYADFGVVLYK